MKRKTPEKMWRRSEHGLAERADGQPGGTRRSTEWRPVRVKTMKEGFTSSKDCRKANINFTGPSLLKSHA